MGAFVAECGWRLFLACYLLVRGVLEQLRICAFILLDGPAVALAREADRAQQRLDSLKNRR